MRVLSLFDGISGARQALKELNIDCEYYFSSEIDKYAIEISKKNHPDITQIGDVRGIEIEDGYIFYNQNSEPLKNGGSFKCNIDLLVGGFPCQSFSIAGNRKGLEDDRGQLFFELLRILEQVKPKHFLFENVASMSKANQAFISEKLGVEPIKINSALLTAQQRNRLYWTNIPNINQPEDKGIALKDIIEYGFFKKNQGQVVFDKPVRLSQLDKDCQSGRIYSIDGKSVCLNAGGGGGGAKTGLYQFKDEIRKLTITECERLQGFPDGYCNMVSKTQAYKALGNSFTVPVIKHILKELNNDK